uniref:probable N-acetyltransferase CML3 n=1 Tax=Monopterus albus TaxID=43700 RepID=UPI0009B397E1|nr:probable N-acetyltransferase CML3 [Monopterus albus]
MSLFRDGTLEHVYPSFVKATSHQDHVGIALSFSMCWEAAPTFKLYSLAVYGSASFITIYYCCHNVYESYMMRRLSTDMADIQASYLENPDNGFWVAEVNGQPKVVGMVAVMGKTREEEGEGGDDWNGGTIQGGSEFAHETADRSYGEMSHVVVRFPWCCKNLGSQLTQKASDFCKERGYARLALGVSSPQTAAISMFQRCGFLQTA